MPREFRYLGLVLASLLLPAAVRPAEPVLLPLVWQVSPLVLAGSSLPSLSGQPVASLRLLAVHAGALQPIPFQVDCRGPDGEYLISPYQPAPDPQDSCGRLQEKDEVVFMAKDAGARLPPTGRPAGAGAVLEISVSDPHAGRSAWAYLVQFRQNPPPLASQDYVVYRRGPDRETVDTLDYHLGYPPDNVFIYDLAITPAAGGNGRDLVDRIKMRTEVVSRGGLMTVKRNEDDFTTRVVGVRDGPVRVIRRTDTRLAVFWGITTPAARVDALYYLCTYEVPSLLSLPFAVDLVARDLSYRQGYDLNRNALGMKFYSNLDPAGVTLDGKMSEDEVNLAQSQVENKWGLLTGEPGTLLYEGIWAPDTPFKKLLYYRDDLSLPDPPEDDPGQLTFAYRLRDMLAVKDAAYRFNIICYILPHYPGGPEPAVEMMKNPLQAKVGVRE